MSRILIRIPGESRTAEAADGTLLLETLRKEGIPVPAECGGRGTCGKCRVQILAGRFDGPVSSDGSCLACRVRVSGDAEVLCPWAQGGGLDLFAGRLEQGPDRPGVALDIGTTTVAMLLMGPEGVRERASFLNPQRAFGADVMSRIQACAEGKTAQLQALLLKKLGPVLEEWAKASGGLERMVVAGNTTMLHLFCGEDAGGMGRIPFTPKFLEMRKFPGRTLGFPVGEITVLPSASAFFGSDLTAGLYAAELTGGSPRAILDVGTNGEMAVCREGRLFCASTAAGPALEGADIECGMGGVEGAVDHVRISEGRPDFSVIGGGRARGICGSGLVELIAALLEEGIVDEGGAFAEGEGGLFRHLADGRFFLTPEVWLSQKDIRQFQLAKSAIYSGLVVLAESAGVRFSELERLSLAGGMGFYLDKESAVRTGLLPAAARDRIRVEGNTSLLGAALCLARPEREAEVAALCSRCEIVELADNPRFSEEFMRNMMF